MQCQHHPKSRDPFSALQYSTNAQSEDFSRFTSSVSPLNLGLVDQTFRCSHRETLFCDALTDILQQGHCICSPDM